MIPCTLSGSGAPATAPRSIEHPRVLLRVQGIATGSLDDRGVILRAQERPIEQRDHQSSGFLVRERREGQGRGVELAAAPGRPSLEELRPRGADDEQRQAAHPFDQVVDEVEQPVVGPVQILEHEHRGRLLGDPFHEPPPRGEPLHLTRARTSLIGRADEHAKVPQHPFGVLSRGRLGGSTQLRLGLARRVAVQDSGLRLHDLRERPEADALAVRKRTTLPPDDQLAPLGDDLHRLEDEPRLADAGRAHEREELRRLLVQDSLDDLARGRRARGHGRPAEQRASARDVDPEARAGLRPPPTLGSARPCPSPARARLAILDRPLGRAIRLLPHENPVHRRRGLQPRRRVHHVPRHHPLPLRRPRTQRHQAPRLCAPRSAPAAPAPPAPNPESRARPAPPAPDRPRAPPARRTPPLPHRR